MTGADRMIWTETIPVRWGDMDALGHVNNAEYFRYIEQARVSWFTARRIPMLENARGPVIVRAGCEFLRPIVFPATVVVSTEVVSIGRSSFTVRHEIRDAGEPAVHYASADAVVVWIDHNQGRSVPLPEPVRAALR
ncbi:MAG: acyl-CoA thioesterase [Chromatiales bacterium]|jgi:acyl-CoA thioester hydrolase|nr:acyl-CoA thioesterase [Chromatiales bacterium]